MGGLGNQLFQYAAGRRLSLKRDARLEIDVGWFRGWGGAGMFARKLELDRFDLDLSCVRIRERAIARWERTAIRPLGHTRFLVGRRRQLTVIRQDPEDFGVNEAVLTSSAGVLLIGYWQSERYFSDVAAEIRADLQFSADRSHCDTGLASAIESTDSVSVHIRRGDYVAVPHTNAFHGVLSLDYYRRALRAIGKQVPNPHLYVFSDDPTWAKEHLRSDYAITHVSRADADAFGHLRLMSMCKHHVIANSSFSWWGAWLSANADKIVVAPKRWFSNPALDTSDMVPPSWSQL